MKKKLVLTLCAALLSVVATRANKLPYIPDSKAGQAGKIQVRTSTGDCVAGASQTDLYINDVRARMLDDGDKWWDLNVAHYIVPQVAAGQTAVSSIFAGAIWVGGIDAGGQLKIAAATYRQNGNDWFPGPIPYNSNTKQWGAVTETICNAFDNHWQVFGGEIDSFLAGYAAYQAQYGKGSTYPVGLIASDILMWPGAGNVNNPVVTYAGPGATLAPFEDAAGTGIYDPTHGDYPIIQPSVSSCGTSGCGPNSPPEYGDQMIWWCYNDLGNIHTETGGIPIGMEVKEEAWAYKTNNNINDMTFYHYQITNTASTVLDSTFMAQWVDPDLGCYLDDYVGCDSTRSLGMDYNGQAVDGGSGACAAGFPNYGDQPPIVGTTYFQGPHYSYVVGKDTIDTCLRMSSFIWYNNDFTAIGNPVGAAQYYGYMSGTWKDGSPFTKYGNGHGGTQKIKYMFPSDPTDQGNNAWSECEAHDVFGDRRYIQASGPFVLQPGAVNDIVVGAVWVRPPLGSYPCPSFTLIDQASDVAQALFNSCFQVLNGPNAPNMTITELDQQLVINLTGTNNSLVELYKQVDPSIKALGITADTFKFEGYQIYQLVNNQVTPQNYTDITQAKLIAQCDLKNGVSTIINFIFNSELNKNVPTLMVQGANQGIKHTFDVTTDAFAQGTSQLINFQPYYFSVVSYAYNNYKDTSTTYTYDSTGPNSFKKVANLVIDSQPLPYLEGRKNIAVYIGIPHKPAPEAHGTSTNSFYGEGPFITRQEGQGNGGNFLDLTQASVNVILANGIMAHPTYQEGEGPITIKVIDPKRVPADSFVVYLRDTGLAGTNNSPADAYTNGSNLDSCTTTWVIHDITEGVADTSDTTIAVGNEQLFPQWGISIYISSVLGPGYNTRDDNGYITSNVVYADPKIAWLTGLQIQPVPSPFAWELSGTSTGGGKAGGTPDWAGADDNLYYTTIAGGTWAPYIMTSTQVTYTPAWKDTKFPPPSKQSTNYPFNTPTPTSPSKLDSLNSVDIVFTSDQSLWSKCVVVEEQQVSAVAQGGEQKGGIRLHQSWTGQVDGNGNPVYSNTPGDIGYSYFPGYAINLETGQRLNIFFGEDSWLVSENGADMIWNPTSDVTTPVGAIVLGGQHYIYVSNTQYDGCDSINYFLTNGMFQNSSFIGTLNGFRHVYSRVEWTGMTYVAQGSSLLPLSQGLIPTTTTVQIRIAKPYSIFSPLSDSLPEYSFGLKNLAADTSDMAVAKTALDSIEVVPNPYYAYSNYEQTALDNEIKFTNLPQVCTISIYTLDGQLVNTINYVGPYEEGKLNNTESTNWDLTNVNGTPVASGIYLIYFSSPGLGTKCIKWFGVRRPIDIGNF